MVGMGPGRQRHKCIRGHCNSQTRKVLEDIWSSPQGKLRQAGTPTHHKGLLALITSEKFQKRLFVSQTDTQMGHPMPALCICARRGCVVCQGWLQVSPFTMATLIHFLDSRDLLPSSTEWPPPRGTEAIPVTTSGQGDGAQRGPNANLEVWASRTNPTARGPSSRTR